MNRIRTYTIVGLTAITMACGQQPKSLGSQQEEFKQELERREKGLTELMNHYKSQVDQYDKMCGRASSMQCQQYKQNLDLLSSRVELEIDDFNSFNARMQAAEAKLRQESERKLQELKSKGYQ
jgi:hypothetical protein